MELHSIFLIGGADDETATLRAEERDDACNLELSYRGKVIAASADDFFEALCMVRLGLESDGLLLFCYGSSLNVYPSGMARSMASGKVAYKMQEGRHASKSDLVSIYAEGPDVIPATVSQQREYFNAWASSERA
ncbi:hypothetical protein SNE35_24810 [Paucibacter sp. R3-3]|uniref:Uncharacterized protein n=1 Tax=Roseateles agri TaxID=3098619 RepID=A0ABU5DN85_9BURK|nr:hypothetical protein [Paucibacter sp. R3-3]MDY0747748.1 hypothetical protein [Paucibacter sp. R3-3]